MASLFSWTNHSLVLSIMTSFTSSPPHAKDLNLAYSCIQRDTRCSDNVATDLSLSLKTGLLLSASIITAVGLSILPDLHQVLALKESSNSAQNIKNRVGILCWTYRVTARISISKLFRFNREIL